MDNPKVLERVVEETRQVMKKRRPEVMEKRRRVMNEMLPSKAEHTVKEHMYPRTTWDIPRFWQKPNFAFLKVPQWVNEREEGDDVTDEQFTRWGLDRRYPLEGWMLPEKEEEVERLKRVVADQECRAWKPTGEILAAHVSIQETTTPNQQANKEKINIKIHGLSGEETHTFIYENHQRIEDLYMDLLITRFVRAIRDQEGKDINMVDQIKNYKQIFIEARAVGPRIGKYSLQLPWMQNWSLLSGRKQKKHPQQLMKKTCEEEKLVMPHMLSLAHWN